MHACTAKTESESTRLEGSRSIRDITRSVASWTESIFLPARAVQPLAVVTLDNLRCDRSGVSSISVGNGSVTGTGDDTWVASEAELTHMV